MPTKNINTNTNINKININIPKPRQPKAKSINQAEKELKDLESKDYQYSRTPNVSLSINPNVYGFNTTPIGTENRVLERPSTPTISIEEQQTRQAEQQERTRQAQEEIQRQEEIARQNAEIQEQQDELFRRESINRSGLGNLRQSYFQSRGGNDFQSRMGDIPVAQAYPSEYETENEKISTKLRNTPYGKARLAAEQRYLDKLQEEKDAREEQKRKGRKAGGANRPKDEIQKEKQSKEDARQKREEGKQKAREMRAKQEEEDKVRKEQEQKIVQENLKKIEEEKQAKADKKKEKEERKQMKVEEKASKKKGLRTRTIEVDL